MHVQSQFTAQYALSSQKRATHPSGAILQAPLKRDSARFGNMDQKKDSVEKTAIDLKDVKLEPVAIAHLKNVFKIPVPAPAGSTWPLSLMSLLCADPDVDSYLSRYCQVKSHAISSGIDKNCLPRLLENRREERLSADKFQEFVDDIRRFAASEGKKVVNSVDLWRWMLKKDSTGMMETYLKACALDESAIKRLREASLPNENRYVEKQQRLTKDEINILNNALKILPTKILGQNEPIESVIKAIKRARNGYDLNEERPNRPVNRILLLGPSGVGKTRTAELMAQLFNKPVVYITMTEYCDSQDAKKFTGSSPGYVGYDSPNFVDKVNAAKEEAIKRGSPPPVIILDEIEKAHPDVQRTLMQILDIGVIENGRMEKATFRGCDIIMTSNVAQKEISEAQERGASDKEIEEIVDKALKQSFAQEFLGRIGKKIIFKSLSLEDAGKILDLQVAELAKAAKDRDGYILQVDKSILTQILNKGYSRETGVRKLKDYLETYIHEPLTEEIGILTLSDINLEGGIMSVKWDEETEKPVFNFTPVSTSKALAIPDDTKNAQLKDSSNELSDIKK